MNRMITVLFFFLILPSIALAGTAGKIKGKVTDLQTSEPLIGANVLVVGTSFGSATDVNGDYVISNLDAGVYEVRASYVGYQTITISNIRVNADLTTELNFELPAEGIEVGEIEVIGERPLVQKDLTNAQRITTSEDIDALPIRGINAIVELTPGVVVQDETVFIRGGRRDEVGFYLEGASITNPLVGGRNITINSDAIEEIQIQAGGYTAEFGGANAGIIRQQFKSGTPDFKASIEYITDNVNFKGNGERYDGEERLGTRWYGYSDFIATLSGPIVDPRFKFFGLFNYGFQADKNPQPYPGINLGRIGDSGTEDTVNFIYPAGAVFKNSLETITGTGTLTLDFNPLIFRLAGTYTERQTFDPFSSSRAPGNIANILNTVRTEVNDLTDGSFSIKGTHILSENTYYEVSAGYSFNKIKQYDPFLKDDFLSYGDSVANANAGFVWTKRPNGSTRYTRENRYNIFTFSFNAPGDVVAAYQNQLNENLNLNLAVSSVVNKQHSLKLGGELQLYTMRNYSFTNEGAFALAGLLATPGTLTREQIFINRGVNNYGYDVLGNEYDGDDPVDKPHQPMFASFYVQDKIELENLIINAGLRFDYIDVDNFKLFDPSRPDLSFNKSTGEVWRNADGSITGAGPGYDGTGPGTNDPLVEVPTFSSVSPRLGFSFPVTDQTVFHAQYGKFVQQTRLRDIYQGYYATSSSIGGGFFIPTPVGFDARPTRTTQYELGFTQQIGDFASFDITGYYKDIQGQVVYKLQTISEGSYGSYAYLTNGDFATTKGLEIAFNMRRQARFQVNGSLSFQDARGTGSYPNSNRGIVAAPLDGVTIFEPAYVSPLQYNNALKGSFNIDYRWGKDDGGLILQELGLSALLTFNSGHPFTQGKGGDNLEGDARDRQPIEPLNESTTPWNYQVDVRLDKTFSLLDKLNVNIYIQVINLFDTRNIENVFLRTGSVDDDGFLTDPAGGGQLVESLGQDYADLYEAININYYEQWQNASAIGAEAQNPFFFGPPRQIRLGIQLQY
jgi:hypothetical protein